MAEEILIEYAKYKILNRFMLATRKVYTPGVCTSQESDTEPHKLFAEILVDAGNIIESKYDEGDGDVWDDVREVWVSQGELNF